MYRIYVFSIPEKSRRELLKAVSGIGIGATATGILAGTSSAVEPLPNDVWPYNFGRDQDSNCPGTITNGELVLRDDGEFTTVGSYGLNWYGTTYGDILGWGHGLGFGGGCEVKDNDTWDGTSWNLRGQRFSIHVPNPTNSDSMLTNTSERLNAIHPTPTDDNPNWAKTILEASITKAMGTVNFGIPISNLLSSMSGYNGYDDNKYEVGYEFEHTADSYPHDYWSECAHSNAVIYSSGDNLLETVTLKHGYLEHIYLTGADIWTEKEYTVSGFESNASSSSTDLQANDSDQERPTRRPSSGHPEEMTPEERRQWGVKSVKGKGLTREVNGREEKITHILTKNPFTVVDEKVTTEKVEADN